MISVYSLMNLIFDGRWIYVLLNIRLVEVISMYEFFVEVGKMVEEFVVLSELI